MTAQYTNLELQVCIMISIHRTIMTVYHAYGDIISEYCIIIQDNILYFWGIP